MDDDPKPKHLVFANRLIREFVDHLLGDDMIVLPADFTTIRVAFRSSGGSWEQFHLGDIKQINLLSKLIAGWGNLPNRVREPLEIE